ncbi:uncharacterized protein LOC133221181 [Neopsephotus bourkii]|uniref:uncharacterized protein LOC133221181 n=1 Tax=Neopsephotus bourkii TaxID=309878 RepID=UPI002AA57DBD|nr:uncharacterized protein LOC133221181 [Neopsephotus bourkii]
MIAVSLKLVRKEREGLRTPTASRPGRHLNSLRIAPPDSLPPARPRRRRSVRPGRAAATGCPPQPRHPLRRPTSPATAFLSSPRQQRGSARRTPAHGTTWQRSPLPSRPAALPFPHPRTPLPSRTPSSAIACRHAGARDPPGPQPFPIPYPSEMGLVPAPGA